RPAPGVAGRSRQWAPDRGFRPRTPPLPADDLSRRSLGGAAPRRRFAHPPRAQVDAVASLPGPACRGLPPTFGDAVAARGAGLRKVAAGSGGGRGTGERDHRRLRTLGRSAELRRVRRGRRSARPESPGGNPAPRGFPVTHALSRATIRPIKSL